MSKKVYTERSRSGFTTFSFHERGFTLIELLVVISIIGILSAIGLVAYSSVLKQGRDSKRQSDLKSIQSALEMYRADEGEYPCGVAEGTCEGTSGSFGYAWNGTDGQGGGWATDNNDGMKCNANYPATLENVLETNDYMADVPHDPFGGCAGNPYNSGYMYEDHLSSEGGQGGLNYCFYARLETLSSGITVGCNSCPQGPINNNGKNYCVTSP